MISRLAREALETITILFPFLISFSFLSKAMMSLELLALLTRILFSPQDRRSSRLVYKLGVMVIISVKLRSLANCLAVNP
jgi:hypothetical protein